MIRSVRVAMTAVASLVLLAAGKVPQIIAAEVATPTLESPRELATTLVVPDNIQLAALTPPTPQLNATMPDDEILAESDAARPTVRSLGELVD